MQEVRGPTEQIGEDPVEYLRSAIAAYCCRPDLSAKEVHIGRLTRLYERAGLSNFLESSIDTLDQLREIQRLDGGYWLPTPIRYVGLTEEVGMILAVHPTEELRRHFRTVRRSGEARLLNPIDAATTANQSLVAWLGSDSRSTETWARLQLSLAKDLLAPSIYDDSVQVFGLKRMETAWATFGTPTWLTPTSSGAASWQGFSLLRSRAGGKRYRYFLGRIGPKQSLLEGPQVKQHLRFRYGFAALLNLRLRIEVQQQGGRTLFKLPILPPESERRLLLALCLPEGLGDGYLWSCPTDEIWPIVRDGLQNLGCEYLNHG